MKEGHAAQRKRPVRGGPLGKNPAIHSQIQQSVMRATEAVVSPLARRLEQMAAFDSEVSAVANALLYVLTQHGLTTREEFTELVAGFRDAMEQVQHDQEEGQKEEELAAAEAPGAERPAGDGVAGGLDGDLPVGGSELPAPGAPPEDV